jgi:hypothetical protein
MAWAESERQAIVKTLAVVYEVSGTEASPAAAEFILKQLEGFPARGVLAALVTCAAECRFKLTLADVVSRIDDGRPGAEQAWSLFPKNEEDAGVVTEEMSIAWGVAAPLYLSDKIGARMAFKESYERAVREARANAKSPVWRITAGFDKAATEGAAIEALRKGLVSPDAALQFVPPEKHDRVLQAAGLAPKMLPALPGPTPSALARQVLEHWQERAERKGDEP